MRPQAIALLCLALGASACRTGHEPGGPIGVRNMWAANEIRQAALHQAILSQSTLYSYHFVIGSDALNELGWRDVEVLAEHFVAHGGTLSVRRGDASEELYGARVQAIEAALAAAGVEPGRVRVSDSPPGGPGTTSERVLEVLENMKKVLETEDASSTSSSDAPSTSSTSSSAAASNG